MIKAIEDIYQFSLSYAIAGTQPFQLFENCNKTKQKVIFLILKINIARDLLLLIT